MDKREQILNAALKLFVEFGFHGTPTSKIAQEARVSNGTLFHYFKTKDELVVALYVHIKTSAAVCFDLDQKEGETVKNTFKRVYLGWVFWSLGSTTEFKFIRQFHSSPYFAMVSDPTLQDQMSRLMKFMRDSVDARLLKQLPVDFLFALINNHIDGLIEYLVATEPDEEKRKELINVSFDLIWDMLT